MLAKHKDYCLAIEISITVQQLTFLSHLVCLWWILNAHLLLLKTSDREAVIKQIIRKNNRLKHALGRRRDSIVKQVL